MDAKDYLSGVYLDDKNFSKKETIELMEDYFKYKVEYNEQTEDFSVWLKKENIISLKKHLEYILSKIELSDPQGNLP